MRTHHNVTRNVHCVSRKYLTSLFHLYRLLNRKAFSHLQFVLSSVEDDLWICIWFLGSNPALYEYLTDNKVVEFGVGQNVGLLKWRNSTSGCLSVCPECLLPLQILLRGTRPFICLLNVASCLPCHQALCTGIIFEDVASNCKSGLCSSLFCEPNLTLNHIHYILTLVLFYSKTNSCTLFNTHLHSHLKHKNCLKCFLKHY
jgi:hypothetical protein